MKIPDEELKIYPFLALFMTIAAAFGVVIGWFVVVYFGVVTIVMFFLVLFLLRRRANKT